MLLRHTVTIERNTPGAADDRSVGAASWATLETARAWVQPKSSKELMQLSQAGPNSSTHTIYIDPGADITGADRIAFGGATYQLDGDPLDEAGMGHHFKADAHLVTP